MKKMSFCFLNPTSAINTVNCLKTGTCISWTGFVGPELTARTGSKSARLRESSLVKTSACFGSYPCC